MSVKKPGETSDKKEASSEKLKASGSPRSPIEKHKLLDRKHDARMKTVSEKVGISDRTSKTSKEKPKLSLEKCRPSDIKVESGCKKRERSREKPTSSRPARETYVGQQKSSAGKHSVQSKSPAKKHEFLAKSSKPTVAKTKSPYAKPETSTKASAMSSTKASAVKTITAFGSTFQKSPTSAKSSISKPVKAAAKLKVHAGRPASTSSKSPGTLNRMKKTVSPKPKKTVAIVKKPEIFGEISDESRTSSSSENNYAIFLIIDYYNGIEKFVNVNHPTQPF